jgi:predicted Rossmann fold flavoprotein
MKTNYEIIVIGGGAAGMMAAGIAAEQGARVLLLEKNNRLGKKLALTGGGRCNITNAEFDNHLFLDNFSEAKQFLLSPFSQFNTESTFAFFERLGLPLMVEDGKRAFPESESAEDVCTALEEFMKRYQVVVKLGVTVKSLIAKKGEAKGIKTNIGNFTAKKIILATGGLAAPETGSTGDGLNWLKTLGYTVAAPDTNLSPLKTSTKWVHALAGVSIDMMQLRFLQNGKTKHKVSGRILFTHFGISGPVVINSAHKVKKLLDNGKVDAAIDLFPNLNLGELNDLLLRRFEEHKNKQLKTVLKDLVQKKLVDIILQQLDASLADTPMHSVTKEQRKLLASTLKALSFPITGLMGLDWSIVADGGVNPKEINSKHMNSRLHPNLYLIGDVVDINRPSGGFSLQLCWTTGYVAGMHAAKKD